MVARRELPIGTFKFPIERESDYKGIITFRPVRYTPPEVSAVGISNLLTRQGSLRNFSEDAIGGFFEGFDEARTPEDVATSLEEAANLDNTTLDTDPIVSPATSVVDRRRGVILYLPSAILVQDAIGYENFDLGAIGAIGLSGAQAGQGITRSLAQGFGQATGSLANLLQGDVANQRGARLAASRLAEQGNAVVSGVTRAGLATTINPNTINLFRNVQIREFQFTFKLIANSERESLEIENIIKFFRASMYPDTINFDPNGINVPIGYEFPDKFQIEMSYNGQRAGVRILNSVLRQVQTNYNPQSMVWHKNGKPTEVDLQLSFGEERALNRNDIIGDELGGY